MTTIVPIADAIETIRTERLDGALNGASRDVGKLGGLIAMGALMKHLDDVHAFADAAIRVRLPFFRNDVDFGLGEIELEPGTHGVLPCDAGMIKMRYWSNHCGRGTRRECVVNRSGEYIDSR